MLLLSTAKSWTRLRFTLRVDTRSKLFVAAAILSGCGVLGKASLVERFVPLPLPLLYASILLGLTAPVFWQVALRFRRPVALAGFAGLLLCFSVAFPRMQELHKAGRGSDQADCVILAANHIVAGQWPYRRDEMWTRNPMSCGPGWVALQAPAIHRFGYPVNLLAIWCAALLVLVLSSGWDRTAGLLALLCLSPGFWLTAIDGSDFLSFGIAAAALFSAAARWGRFPWARASIALAAGLLGQFRAATLVLPAFLAGQIGPLPSLLAVVFSLGWQIAFLFWNPGGYLEDGPLHIVYKLTLLHLFSRDPLLASLELGLPLLATSIGIVFLERRFGFPLGVPAYFAAIFAMPAIPDLVLKWHRAGTLLPALQAWEGGIWIAASLPFLAWSLLRGREAPEQAG